MRRIHELLAKKKKKVQGFQEAVKLKSSEPNKYGYFVIITSDNPDPNEASKEAAQMASILNLTKSKAAAWNKPFNPPKYWKDNKSGRFGWGYLITPTMDDTQRNTLINNLKELVADFNKAQELEADLETQGLTESQIETIQQIVQQVETAEESTLNERVKANLDKYLDDLAEAVESDEVYDFLIKTYQNVNNFQNRNTAWKYSFLNSLTITYGDPDAILAGPKQYWEERNYRIKEEFVGKGIMITKMGRKSDVAAKAAWFKSNPDEFEKYKREKGIPVGTRIDDYIKTNAYQLAVYATEKGLGPKQRYGSFTTAATYTDTMVEPIPGKEVEPIQNDSTYIPEKGQLSAQDVQKVEAISNAVMTVAAKNGIRLNADTTTNINVLNKMLSTMAAQFVKGKLKYRMKGSIEVQRKEEEIIMAYGEVVSHIIKSHYGLPSESAKYNIANLGGDKEALHKESNTILNLANKLISDIDLELNANAQNNLSEIRHMIYQAFQSILN